MVSEAKELKNLFEGEAVQRGSRDHLLWLGYQAGAQMGTGSGVAFPSSLLQ